MMYRYICIDTYVSDMFVSGDPYARIGQPDKEFSVTDRNVSVALDHNLK